MPCHAEKINERTALFSGLGVTSDLRTPYTLPRPLIYFDDFDRQLGRSYELYSSPPRERYRTS